jgi:hypothetical protein
MQQDATLTEFLQVLRRAMRLIKATGDTRRGLIQVKKFLDKKLLTT